MSKFDFPIGYHKFHRKPLFNFQMNRWYSLGCTGSVDMKAAEKKIITL